MSKERLDKGLDKLDRGKFTMGRSASQAIVQPEGGKEIQNKQKSTSHSILILFDWKKSVSQNWTTSARNNETVKSPPRIYNLIQSFYANPQFQVKCGEVESECHTEYAGIREGRPVSPYLFTLVIGETLCRHKRSDAQEGKWNSLMEHMYLRSDTRTTP